MTLVNIITQSCPALVSRQNLASQVERSLHLSEILSGSHFRFLSCFIEDNDQPILIEPEPIYRYLHRQSRSKQSIDNHFRISFYFSALPEARQTKLNQTISHEPSILVVPFDWKPFVPDISSLIHIAYDARVDLCWKEETTADLQVWTKAGSSKDSITSLKSFAHHLTQRLARFDAPENTPHKSARPSEFHLCSAEQTRLTRAAQSLIEQMSRGECYLCNLTTLVDVPRTYLSRDIGHFLKRWSINPSRFAWMIRRKDLEFDCYSPERFFKVQDGILVTEPIKGTAAFKGQSNAQNPDAISAASELWLSEKERCEQHLVTDLLRNDMASLCIPGTIDVTEPMGIRLTSGLCQMSSRIEGRLSEKQSLFDILGAMLPAGSVTGTPKSAVTPLLSSLEVRERGLYCGLCIDWPSATQAEATLLIRGVFGDSDSCYVGTGAGLTILSDPKAEIEEMELKLQSFLGRCFDHQYEAEVEEKCAF